MSEKSRVIKRFTVWGIFFSIIVLFSFSGIAQDHHETHVISEADQHDMEEADFNAGEMIIEHITDSYEWHIINFGETHITIPLPVILYDEGQWHIFMSSKFHHGHDVYKGYFISHDEMDAGKIVKLDSHGNEIRPTLDLSITKNVLAIFISMIFM